MAIGPPDGHRVSLDELHESLDNRLFDDPSSGTTIGIGQAVACGIVQVAVSGGHILHPPLGQRPHRAPVDRSARAGLRNPVESTHAAIPLVAVAILLFADQQQATQVDGGIPQFLGRRANARLVALPLNRIPFHSLGQTARFGIVGGDALAHHRLGRGSNPLAPPIDRQRPGMRADPDRERSLVVPLADGREDPRDATHQAFQPANGPAGRMNSTSRAIPRPRPQHNSGIAWKARNAAGGALRTPYQ